MEEIFVIGSMYIVIIKYIGIKFGDMLCENWFFIAIFLIIAPDGIERLSLR